MTAETEAPGRREAQTRRINIFRDLPPARDAR